MKTDPTTPSATPEVLAPAPSLAAYMDAKFKEAGIDESETPAAEDPETPAPKEEPKKPAAPAEVPDVDGFTTLEDSEEEEGEEEESEDPEAEGEEGDDEIPEAVKKQGEKAITTWGELKTAKREAEKTVRTLDAKVKDLEARLEKSGTGNVDAELTALRERVAEQERVIAATKVEASEEYRKAVTEPLDTYGKTVQDLVDDPATVEKIFDAFAAKTPKERVAKLTEATEELSELARLEIYDISKKVAAVFAQEQLIKEKAIEARAEIEKNELTRVAKETAAEKETRLAAADKVWKNTQKNLPFMFTESGDLRPEFAEVAVKGKEVAITEAAVGTQVFAGYAVQLVPLLAKEVAAKEKAIADLQTQIDRLTGASPKKQQGSVAPSPKDSPGKKVPLVDRLDQRFKAAGY